MLVLGATVTLNLLLPIILLWVQWRRVAYSRVGWLLESAAVGAYLLLLLLAGVWIAAPRSLGYVYLAAWALIAWRQYRRMRRAPRESTSTVLAASYGLATALFVATAIHAAWGRRPPAASSVDLAFPLREGLYYVVSGGGNALMNFHFMTLAERYKRFRGQSYAIDVVKLNRYGVRTSSLLPRELADYETFGAAVYAPCSGTVARTVNALPDLVPPARDRVNLAGNFVALECRGVRVLLAHFKRGSIVVEAGARVAVGDLLGQIGNSGNTDEPHLHIHAERPTARDNLLDAEPVPATFDGRYLARNDSVRAAP